MKNRYVFACLMAAGLVVGAACSKNKTSATTPDTKTGTTETKKTDTGGATYGSAAGSGSTMGSGAAADPCAGK